MYKPCFLSIYLDFGHHHRIYNAGKILGKLLGAKSVAFITKDCLHLLFEFELEDEAKSAKAFTNFLSTVGDKIQVEELDPKELKAFRLVKYLKQLGWSGAL